MPKRKRGRSHSKTGYFGVTNRASGKHGAAIKTEGIRKYLGLYATAEQAAKAYDKEAIKAGKPFSQLNYPEKAPVGYTPIQKALTSRNTVGYRGVYKMRKKFKAQIKIGGKRTHIGLYDTPKEAAIAYDRAVLKAKQCTSLLNFPDMVHNLDVEPKRKKRKLSSSGYRGVRKTPYERFAANIRINGKLKSLGTFATAIQAALAYDQAAIKAGKKKSMLNFSKDKKKQKKTKKTKRTKTQTKDVLTMEEYKEMLQIWEDE
jgi:hypothetical protein